MNFLNRISPVPKKAEYLNEPSILIGTQGAANCCIKALFTEECALGASACRKLMDRFTSLLNAAVAPCADVEIRLELADAPQDMVNAEQGYEILAQDNTIILRGFGEAGLYYAVTTFLQILHMDAGRVYFPACHIVDSPDLKTRGHFMETRYGSNLMELDDWKAVVDHMEEMKQNQLTVSVYGCWCD